MTKIEIISLIFGLGFCSGLRTVTPVAVLCWFTHFRKLSIAWGWLSFAGNPISLAIFTVGALAEFFGDKRPTTPSRLSPPQLAARLIFGGVSGALGAHALHVSRTHGLIGGAVGALVGSLFGYYARTLIKEKWQLRDLPVAIAEDFVAIVGSIVLVYLISR